MCVIGVIWMRRKEIEDMLYGRFAPLVKSEGAELLDVEIASENRETYLRVAIYHPEGVTLDLCAAVQKVLSDDLDQDDPMPGSYTLEVSSPGLERTLKRPKEFEVFKGQLVKVTLFKAIDGKKSFEGKLLGLAGGDGDTPEQVVIDAGETTLAFDRKTVGSVRLVYQPRAQEEGGGRNER